MGDCTEKVKKVMWGLTPGGQEYMLALNRKRKWKFRLDAIANGRQR